MRWLVPLASGLLFGAGLAIGGMLDPARVRGFLDLFGHWDPSLMLVMAGALAVMIPTWLLRPRLAKPLAGEAFDLPDTQRIDAPLVIGAVLFGIGWGLTGLCPGPVIASLALVPQMALPFFLAMAAGMALYRLYEARKTR